MAAAPAGAALWPIAYLDCIPIEYLGDAQYQVWYLPRDRRSCQIRQGLEN
jgi:hypothetical protein